MPSFGIYDDGTDNYQEVEEARRAREAEEAAAIEEELRLLREKAKKEEDDARLAEEAAAASQAFRDTNPFSDGVTTGPTQLDPFVVSGGPKNLFTDLGSASTGLGGYGNSGLSTVLNSSILGPVTNQSRAIDLSNNPALAGALGFPVQTPEEKEKARLQAILDAETEAEIAAMVAKGQRPPISIGNPLDAIGAAITGATQIIRDPVTGISNIGTNVVNSIFNPGKGQTTITPLPVDPITGLVLTGAALANATRATQARDAAAKAAAEAAAAKAAGVSPEEQARLDAAEQKAVQDQIAADAAVRAQGGTTNISAGILVPAATNAGTAANATGMGPFDVRTAAQVQADAAAAAAAQSTPTSVVAPTDGVAAAQAAAQATAQAIDQEAAWKRQQAAAAAAAQQQRDREAAAIAGMGVATPTTTKTGPDGLFEQTAVTTTPSDWTKVNAAQQAAAQAAQTAQTQAIAGMGVATPTTTKTGPDGLFEQTAVVTPPACPEGQSRNAAGVCVVAPVTPPACPEGQSRNAAGVCVVAPVTPPACPEGQSRNAAGVCVVTPVNPCPAGQERNTQGVCVVPPVNPCPAGQERNAQGVCVVAPPPPGGGGTTTIIPVTPPSTPATMSTITPAQRSLTGELGTTAAAFTERRNALKELYGNALDDYTDADIAAFDKVSGAMRGTNAANTAAASAQTIAANRALRDANLADVNRLGGEALLNRQTLNSQLYGNLNQYSTEASSALGQDISAFRLAEANQRAQNEIRNSQLYGNLNQYSKEASSALGRDMDALRLAEAKQLSPEDIRNSQQAAREAWSARGLVNSRGAVGAEILNRDSLARQREAEARAKVQQSYGNLQQATSMEMSNDSLALQRAAETRARMQQSYGNLQQATAMEQANVFDPQAAILGGQYGMQTQNYGTNAALYGQSANQMAGSQNYVQKVFNPMGEYPNNIYDFNANATTAASIARANNEASVEAARQAGMYGLTAAAMRNSGAIWDGLKWIFG